MIELFTQHTEIVNAILNAVMVLIWTAYLQVFLVSHRRQSRSIIHIDIGAAKGSRSRCLVTNLSSNPIYVQGLVADLQKDSRISRTIVTDRNEISENDVQDPLARTNRGTLHPGETVDIGSLSDLVSRAVISLDEEWSTDQIDSITVTVIAISGQADRIIGATKTFNAENRADCMTFSPQKLLTHQMKPRQTRQRFSEILRDEIQA
ncbi:MULTISPECIES: hypothetical protein [unclassified Yoonia]|uniref:hypothetical protein n=1 Tax=unclassified Yoonia TaxID=2629118 RepID=UPI002AFEB7F8|nr:MULTISPECIES: hypothetical protein [unclassified Yoonia]